MAGTPFGPGTVLAGRFTLEDLLDENDGARFWRATDQTLARSVAVHVLADSDPRASTLLTAARTSALVSDGHLLRVLDASAEGGVVYVVNEWGSGVSLDRMLAEGPLSPRRAAWVVKEVAEAIATAHRNGVAHGRLLPENVMVTEAGSVKLIGFVVDAVLRGREHRRVTGGEPISAHEADVVNLAGLLYAALVGKWPGTEGSSLPDAPTEHGRPLRPRRVRAGVPRPLDAICDRALGGNGQQQAMPLETAHEIYAALSDFIGDPAGTAQVGYEPTTMLDAADLAMGLDGPATETYSAAAVADQTDTGPTDTGDLPATGAMPATPAQGAAPAPTLGDETGPAESQPESELESTQAGAPVFFDEDTGVGWMSGTESRGLRRDETDERDEPAEVGAHTRRTRPPPPPELPARPERPLFADGPSAAAAAAGTRATEGSRQTTDSDSFLGGFTGTTQRSTGAGNGSVPPSWGPDPEDPPPDDPAWETGSWTDDDSGKPWLRLAAAVAGVIVLVVAIVFAFNLGRGTSEAGTSSAAPSTSTSPSPSGGAPLRIAGVTDFDPQGDPPEENPELAPLAVDGKPGTAWQTLTYRGNPKLGGLKSGVGLLVDLGRPKAVGSVRLTLLGDGTSVQVLAAPDEQAAPSSTDGLDTVASKKNVGSKADLRFDKPVTSQWFVVWLTSLPSAPGGFQGQIAEISVRS